MNELCQFLEQYEVGRYESVDNMVLLQFWAVRCRDAFFRAFFIIGTVGCDLSSMANALFKQ